jgi:hypothetical protein
MVEEGLSEGVFERLCLRAVSSSEVSSSEGVFERACLRAGVSSSEGVFERAR